MTQSLAKQEFLGDMPSNKTYKVRQAYWWVFTHPGCFAAGVVEIREARNHGGVVRVRRYSVMEQGPGGGGETRRVFKFEKPKKEWKGDERREYVVYYRPGSRRAGPGENWCGCESFTRRRTCAHLESLLSLANRTPAAAPRTYGPDKSKTHEWERRGPQSFRCVWCGVRAWNPELMDRDQEARVCRGGGPDNHPTDQPPKLAKQRKCPGCGSPHCRNDECKAGPPDREHEFQTTVLRVRNEGSNKFYRLHECHGCGIHTTDPDNFEGSACTSPPDGTAHRFMDIGDGVHYVCEGCRMGTDRPCDFTDTNCPGLTVPVPNRQPPPDRPTRPARTPEKPPKKAPRKAEKPPGKGKPHGRKKTP